MFVEHSVDALYAGVEMQKEIVKGVFDEIWRKQVEEKVMPYTTKRTLFEL